MIRTARPDTTLDYLNATCVDFTGRTLEQPINEGWLTVSILRTWTAAVVPMSPRSKRAHPSSWRTAFATPTITTGGCWRRAFRSTARTAASPVARYRNRASPPAGEGSRRAASSSTHTRPRRPRPAPSEWRGRRSEARSPSSIVPSSKTNEYSPMRCNRTPRHRALLTFTHSAAPRADHIPRDRRIRPPRNHRRPASDWRRSWSRSGNENLARDVSVALPESPFAGEERIVRCRLHVAIGVECP